MKIKSLENISKDELIDCFLLAFENYYVQMPTEKSYYIKRWAAAKVDFSLCYGMFDKDNLVGFIIHAIDNRSGKRIAFNTGTGVIPAYRGQKITKAIYAHAIQDLKAKGIELSQLEVIQENEKAIKVYESVGFTIVKEYNCFSGVIKLGSTEDFELEEFSKAEFDWNLVASQNNYSWDFQKETVQESDYRYFHVLYKTKLESYFIFGDNKNTVAQFDVLNQSDGAWERLFSAISMVSSQIRIINVDSRMTDKLNIILKAHLKNTVNQYEMEMNLG